MLESLTNFVTVLLALSIASERLVELVKGMFAGLNGARPDAQTERKRQLKVHWLSLAASLVVVCLTQDYIISSLNLKDGAEAMKQLSPGLIATFSILASGGSSLWNSILTYLLSLKNMKAQDASDRQQSDNADLFKALPTAMP